MLASVLNSDRAIEVNILVVRVFIKIRTVIGFQRDILDKIKQIEQVLIDYDEKFITIFEYLKKEEQFKIEEEEFKNRRRIGFKPD